MNPLRQKIPFLPPRLEGLAALATNLAWSWNLDARALFRSIDEPLWHLTRHNPIDLLRRVDPGRLATLAQDAEFLRRLDLLNDWMAAEASTAQTWFHTTHGETDRKTIAYFCAEFGLHNSVPIYSGGLGILAGDHCKASSDLGVPLTGVGLMYTRGYFDQHLGLDGWQEDRDERFDFSVTPLAPVEGPNGEAWLTSVPCFGRTVYVGAWRMLVGRVPLYLLDTNLEANDPLDRELSSKLYGVGVDLRLKQEWILGVAGVRALRAVGPQSYASLSPRGRPTIRSWVPGWTGSAGDSHSSRRRSARPWTPARSGPRETSSRGVLICGSSPRSPTRT